jgi:WD40 repeat protein
MAAIPAFPHMDLCALAPEGVILSAPQVRRSGDLSKTPPKSIPLAKFGIGYSIYALAVSPNGTRIAAGTRAGLLRVLTIDESSSKPSHVPIFEVFHGKDLSTGVMALSFLTDSLLVSAGQNGWIRVWDIKRGVCEAEWSAHPGGVVAIRPIGSLVLGSIGMDGVLRVWDLDSRPPDLPR